ncbi:nitroreductase family protein [Kocuria palustris]|uniref:nitroreductase family protein n=1 Tax=Kocuria palustris TaxID=71999 RepID=UPI0011A9A5BE|nr:nitroreductase family protein [Kocuria palustris]
MAAPFLRILSQRRRAQSLVPEAPTRAEIEQIVRAAAGRPSEDEPAPWRVIATTREQAPQLAAALSGLRSLPEIGDGSAPLKGKQLRRLAAFRGSLAFAMRGGLALALVFEPVRGSELSRKRQRMEAHAMHTVLEAALCGAGWGVQWSPRESPDAEVLNDFYGLDEKEEVLGWLFVGRVPLEEARAVSGSSARPGPSVLEFRD